MCVCVIHSSSLPACSWAQDNLKWKANGHSDRLFSSQGFRPDPVVTCLAWASRETRIQWNSRKLFWHAGGVCACLCVRACVHTAVSLNPTLTCNVTLCFVAFFPQVLSHNLYTVLNIPHDPVALEEHFQDDDDGPVSNHGYMPYLNKYILDKVWWKCTNTKSYHLHKVL